MHPLFALPWAARRLSQLMLRSEGGRPEPGEEQQEDLGFGAVHDGREGGARLQRSAGGGGRSSSNVEELNCGSAEIGCHRGARPRPVRKSGGATPSHRRRIQRRGKMLFVPLREQKVKCS